LYSMQSPTISKTDKLRQYIDPVVRVRWILILFTPNDCTSPKRFYADKTRGQPMPPIVIFNSWKANFGKYLIL